MSILLPAFAGMARTWNCGKRDTIFPSQNYFFSLKGQQGGGLHLPGLAGVDQASALGSCRANAPRDCSAALRQLCSPNGQEEAKRPPGTPVGRASPALRGQRLRDGGWGGRGSQPEECPDLYSAAGKPSATPKDLFLWLCFSFAVLALKYSSL